MIKIAATSFIMLVLFFLLILSFLALILYTQRDKKYWKDLVTDQLRRSSNPLFPNLPDNLKDESEWYVYEMEARKLPYLYIDCRKNEQDENIVICHGATTTLENAYVEYKHIAVQHNARLICLEYPGFGTRRRLNNDRVTEEGILIRYPLELKGLLEYLELPWENTTLVGSCLGGMVCCVIASRPFVRGKLKHLILNKPLITFKTSAKNMLQFLPESMVPDIFNIEPYLPLVHGKITCIQGTNDDVCDLNGARYLISKFDKSKTSIRFIEINDLDHDMKLIYALQKCFCQY